MRDPAPIFHEMELFYEKNTHHLYTTAYELDPENYDLALALADTYVAAGNYTKAEYTLVHTISDHPDAVAPYLALSRIYVAQDKLLDAQQMLDHIENEAVRTQLEQMRPEAPVLSPESGYYSDYISVSLTYRSGTPYLRVDGEFPSTSDAPYSAPVELPGGESSVSAIVVGENGLVSPVAVNGYTIGNIVEEVTFASSAFESFVRETLSLDPSAPIMTDNLWDVAELTVPDTVTEIMVNGPDSVFIERDGRLIRWDKSFTSREKLEDVIQQIAGRCNRVINESRPIVDARLENGARVNAVIAPVALNGPILTIRRFPDRPLTLEDLIARKSLTEECADFLKKLVRARYSIVIGGGTGSGKTTFLGALSEFIPAEERIITIEDNAELRLLELPNLVRMEAKEANTEDSRGVTIRDLIRTALRMRPDRVIIGEVRGAEAVDLLQAFKKTPIDFDTIEKSTVM